MPNATPLLPVLALLVGCSSAGELDAGDVNAGLDAPSDAGTDANLAPWPHDRMPLGGEDLRGYHLARGIVHLHSPLSHDACDGEGWVDGALADEECLAHLKSAACTLAMDVLFLTDHAPHIDEGALETGLFIGPGDEPVMNGAGEIVGARWACEGSAHRVLVFPGSENELMPIALERHPPGDAVARSAAYEADGAAAATVLREAGALVFYAHTEGHSLDQLRATMPDGIELYNTHANIDPNIRQDLLGLPSFSYLPDLLQFMRASNRLEPDLALLTFLSANEVALSRWDTLLSEGMHLSGTGGCDAHENTLPQLLSDGERADSYRRMMGWHAQHFLVTDNDRAGLLESLSRGRFSVVFEVFGTPLGFDFRATSSDGSTIFEMGDDAPVGSTLEVVLPTISGFTEPTSAPLRMRLLRAAPGGAVEVATSSDAVLSYVASEAGAYRVEVLMTPEHARPYLGALAERLVQEQVWIYGNPIYVR